MTIRIQLATCREKPGLTADEVLASTPHPWLYARMDVVEAAEGPVLMELELIEPDLFLAHEPAAAERLLDGLLRGGPHAG